RVGGWVSSRRDPSDGQISSVVNFAIPLLRRGAGAFIVIVTGYPYLNLLSSLLLTIQLHLTMSSVVLAARRAPAGKGCRPCPPYLCQVGRMTTDPSMPALGRLRRVGLTTLAGQLFGGTRTSSGIDPTEQELENWAKQELIRPSGLRSSGIDPVEQELNNWAKQELIRPSDLR
ncbi:hypothetical protein B296_00037555, partial [Ensete ventricosum]